MQTTAVPQSSSYDRLAGKRRPVHTRACDPRPQRHNFATENEHRLALLAGLFCPNCDGPLIFDGSQLRCDNGRDCTFGWDRADTAESEVYFGLADPLSR